MNNLSCCYCWQDQVHVLKLAVGRTHKTSQQASQVPDAGHQGCKLLDGLLSFAQVTAAAQAKHAQQRGLTDIYLSRLGGDTNQSLPAVASLASCCKYPV